MKKIISLLTSLCILLSSVAALADTDKLFEALSIPYYSAEATTEFSIKTDSPLTFINTLMENDYESISPVDFQALAESAMTTNQKASTKAYVSEDFRKIKASVEAEAELPLRFNDSLKADIWSQAGIWLNMDLSDINKPVYDMIMKIPFSTKYITLDYSSLAKSGVNIDSIPETIEKFSDKEYIKEISSKLLQLVYDNSSIKETRKNTEYVISIDDSGIKAIFAGYFDLMVEMINEQDPVQAELLEEGIATLGEIGSKINSIPILGEDGCKIKIILAGGKPSVIETTTDIKLNICDITEAMDGDTGEFVNEEWAIDLTLSSKTTYSSLNGKVDIQMPAIDNTNSINPATIYSYENDYSFIISTAYPIETEKEKMMLPLRDCMNSIGLFSYSIDGNTITVNGSFEKYGFEKAVFTNNSDKMIIDSKEYSLSQPAFKNENGLIVIPVDAMEFMTDSVLANVNLSFENGLPNTVTLEKNYFVTEYEDAEDEDYEVYEDYESESVMPYVYEPSYYTCIYFDGRPTIKNGVYYIPARVLFEEMGYVSEGMAFENNSLTIKNAETEIKEFDELILTENSPVIYINGAETALANPVKEIDGTMYVPEEILALLDCEVSCISYTFSVDEWELIMYRNKYDDYNYNYYQEYLHVTVFDSRPYVKNEKGYCLPLRLLMNTIGISDENITLEGETVKVKGNIKENGFEIITLTGNTVTVDNKEYTMQSPLEEVEGSKYVPVEFLTDIMGGKITSVDIIYGEYPSASYICKIKNPMYNADIVE